MSLRKSLAFVAAVTLVGLLTVVGTASAAPTLTVDPTSVEVSGTVTVSGTECYLGKTATRAGIGQVAVAVEGVDTPLLTTGDASGNWSVEAACTAAAGPHKVTASCTRYLEVVTDYPSGTFTVTAPPTATIGEVTRAGCQVSIPVTTTGTGPFTLTVWDDSEVVDSVEWNTPATAEITTLLSWVISEPAQEAAAGVGFVVTVTDGRRRPGRARPLGVPGISGRCLRRGR